MKEHKLKTLACYWDAIKTGEKMFTVRRNDCGFQTGDTLILRRMHEGSYRNYDSFAEPLKMRITYLLQGGQLGIEPGYCVLGLAQVGDE